MFSIHISKTLHKHYTPMAYRETRIDTAIVNSITFAFPTMTSQMLIVKTSIIAY